MKSTRVILISFMAIFMVGAGLFVLASDWHPSKKKDETTPQLKEGDILFQTSVSAQCEAIKLATGSEWTHCGIVFLIDNKWMVLEAVQPVKLTALDNFIDRGEDHKLEVMRLMNSEQILTVEVIAKMKSQGQQWLGKNYDISFNWSDEEIYCSELVWKLYEQCTGLRVGEPSPMRSYDLSSPLVKQIMTQRYGSDIPLDEPMIAPGAIHDSPLLLTVVGR